MKPPQPHSRINLVELKAQFVKKLGSEGSKQYFSFLHRFLSSKMTKFEFNKLCLRILGRENLPLHNRFICSILKNTCTAKSPPPAVYKDDVSKHSIQGGCKEMASDGYQPNGSHASMTQPNGSHGILPISPRKPRSGNRRSSAHEKTDFAPRVAAYRSGDSNVVLEKEQTDVVVRSGVTRESAKSPLQAPLGVLSPPISIGESRRVLPQGNSNQCVDMSSRGALLDNATLREQMENIAVFKGLKEVSVDCAEVLNRGLDSYLKGLISSCIELVGERSGTKNDSYRNQPHTKKLINGLRPGYQPQMQNSGSNHSVPISLQDFRVAMELNPRQLGEDWPLLLEKISTRAFEE